MKTLILKFSICWGALLLATVLLAGCATTPPPPGVSVERKSSRAVAVQSARLRSSGNCVVVWGVLQRSLGYSSSTRQSHLDVDVLGPGGKLVRHTAALHRPFPIARSPHAARQTTYSVELPEVPPPGSVIRVSHHPVSTADCGTPEQ